MHYKGNLRKGTIVYYNKFCGLKKGIVPGELQATFLRLQQIGIIQLKINVITLDSISIKEHSDGMGALTKMGVILLDGHGVDGIPSVIWLPHLTRIGNICIICWELWRYSEGQSLLQ